MLYWPVVLAALTNLICHFSLWAVILLVCSLLSAYLLNVAIPSRHDANINRELFDTLAKYPNYRFEKRDMKELVNRYASYDKIQGMLFRHNMQEVGEVYVAVLEDKSVRKRFKNPKAFPRVFFPNVVLLPDNIEDGDILRQFFFFHELGHLSTMHTRLRLLAARSVAGGACTLFMGACLFPWYFTLALIPFVRFWHCSCMGISLMISHENGEIERLADAFALKVLQNHPDIEELERKLSRLNAPRFQLIRESMDFFKDWFTDTEWITEWMNEDLNFWNRRKAPENSRFSFFYRYGFSSEAVNYNTMIETYCFPHYFWAAYCLCVLLIVGCVLWEPTTAQYILLSAAPLLASALATYRYIFDALHTHFMENAKLTGEDLPPLTEKWKKRLEKSVAPRDGFWQKVKKRMALLLLDDEKRKPLT